MATPVEMPKLGNTVEECILARWLKHEGDRVAEGDMLVEIETDKATFEVPAPRAGTLLATFFEEQALIPVYTNICVIGEPGEDVEPYHPVEAAPRAEVVAPVVERQSAPVEELAEARGRYSPRARRFAREHDFHPPAVTGSGPGGRVLEADVRDVFHAARRPLADARGSVPSRVSSIRERIARRMREAMASSAQYTLHSSAEATGLLRLRRKIKARGAADININELVMFCTVQALQEMPQLNAEFVDGMLTVHSGINLGFACDTERGLLVPVIRGCERLDLAELASQSKELAAKAVAGKLTPDEMTGATFTVSNLGNLGIESFTPILNPPQVALLGVGSIQLKPVRRDGKIESADYIGLSLTCDHQIIDGAPGARFLDVVRRKIEDVEALLCTI